MVITDFQIENKIGKPGFFQKVLFVANIKFKIILAMFFLKFSNTNMLFNKKTFMWKSYIISKVLLINKQIYIVYPKESIIAVLNIKSKTFVLHIAIKKQEKMLIYLIQKAQIRIQN